MKNQLTEQQIRTFYQQGYLHLPQAISPVLLSQLTQDSNALLNHIYRQLKSGRIHPDHAFTCRYFQSYLNRIYNFHRYAKARTMTLLGSDLVQNIVNQLCHRQHILSVDMMIIKNRGDDLDINWHQDIIYDPTKDNIIALGIYLEPAHIDDGAITLIANSHHQQHHIEQLLQQQNQQVTIAAQAGDIIVHNPMLVHRSSSLQKQQIRRTLYYEFRNLAQVQNRWSPNTIQAKQAIERQAISHYHQFLRDCTHETHNLCC